MLTSLPGSSSGGLSAAVCVYRATMKADAIKALWAYVAMLHADIPRLQREDKASALDDFVSRVNSLCQTTAQRERLPRDTIEQVCQINKFLSLHLPQTKQRLVLPDWLLAPEPADPVQSAVADYIKANSATVAGPGVFNGFWAAGRHLKSGKLIVVSRARDYFDDTKKYNLLVRMRRALLAEAKQPFVEVSVDCCATAVELGKYLSANL